MLEKRLPVIMTPGVVNILSNAAGPIALDEAELDAVRRSVESGLPVVPWPYLTVGDRVVVETGVMAGVEGLLVRVKDSVRIVVSVELLQRSLALELDRAGVRPVDRVNECIASEHWNRAAM